MRTESSEFKVASGESYDRRANQALDRASGCRTQSAPRPRRSCAERRAL